MLKVLLLSSLFLFLANANDFEQWKLDYAKRASKEGLKKSFILETLKNIEINKDVIRKDRNQTLLSTKISYKQFMKKWLRDGQRVRLGKEMLKKHKELLLKIEKEYNVDKEVIVSLWGVETLYGKIKGDFNVIQSLVTLAFDGRRRKFYEIQLTSALKLLHKKHISLKSFVGSWAGATGDCQFMPSNVRPYAVDYDNDGIKDIWNNEKDIFASIANLLMKNGWKKSLPIGFIETNRKINKSNLKDIPLAGSPFIRAKENYKPLMRWNNSSLFAAFNIILIQEFKKK